jgi:hypothetical protein
MFFDSHCHHEALSVGQEKLFRSEISICLTIGWAEAILRPFLIVVPNRRGFD